jgi:hypothetical protein
MDNHLESELKSIEPIAKEGIASDNLNNNKVDTTIDPDTIGNYVHLSLCSISINCCIS